MSETRFIYSVHRLLRGGPLKYWKIQAGQRNGVPDCYYAGNQGRFLWAEYKYATQCPRSIDFVKYYLTPLQNEWLIWHDNHGFDTAVIFAVKQHCVVLTNKDWLEPMSRPDFTASKLTKKELVNWLTTRLTA